MHSTQYRPSRSQQLAIRNLISKKNFQEEIVVHHVLEDSFLRLYVQIERRLLVPGKCEITFERIEL